jgi:hypothetical protein
MKIDSEIIFGHLFHQKRSVITNFRQKNFLFKTSFKKVYFDDGSRLLWTRFHKKNFQ